MDKFEADKQKARALMILILEKQEKQRLKKEERELKRKLKAVQQMFRKENRGLSGRAKKRKKEVCEGGCDERKVD